MYPLPPWPSGGVATDRVVAARDMPYYRDMARLLLTLIGVIAVIFLVLSVVHVLSYVLLLVPIIAVLALGYGLFRLGRWSARDPRA